MSNNKVKNQILSMALVAVLTGLLLSPKVGLAQGVSPRISSEVTGSSSGASVSKNDSTTDISSESFASSAEVSSSEAGSTAEPSSLPAESIPGSDVTVSEPLPGAETTIHIPDGQTLVLGEDGAFIFRTDSGEHEDIPADEWDIPAGLYDFETNIVLDGATANLRSVLHAQIASIKGVQCKLKIVGSSDIAVVGTSDVAVDVFDLQISAEAFAIPTKISITAGQIGVQYRETFIIGSLVDIHISAALHGISLFSNPEEQYGSIIYVYQNATLDVLVTGQSGVAISAENMNVYGASITAKAPAGIGGIIMWGYFSAYMHEGVRVTIDASSATGRALSCLGMDVSGADIRGVTPGGYAGVHADQQMSASKAEGENGSTSIYGEAYSGFGIVANNITENAEYPSGSMSLNNCNIEGRVQEGMGISSNTLSINSDTDEINEGRIVGTAQKGIGISVCMLSGYGNVYVEGVSFGATNKHYQVYNSIPDCAGISALSSFNAYGKATVIGKAPKDVAGSYGIHVQLIHEGGYISGYLTINGQDGALATIEATGETGLYAHYFGVNENVTLVATGRLDGIVTSTLYITGYNDLRPSLRGTGEQGAGIKVETAATDGTAYISMANADVVATGGEYGFFATVDSVTEFSNCSFVAKATSPSAVAGMFIQLIEGEGKAVLYLNILNSHIDASSAGYGILMINTELAVSAPNYTLAQPAQIKGQGAESGIKLTYTEEYAAEFLSGERKAIHAKEMALPDGSSYIIWGISTSVAPDRYGRKAAISAPFCEIDGGGIFREEYMQLAQEQLRTDISYPVYAFGMNIKNYTDFRWNSPSNQIDVTSEGVSASDTGTFGAQIEIERASGEGADDNVILTSGTHQIFLIADINIAKVYFYGEGGEPEKEIVLVAIGTPIGLAPAFSKLGSEFVHWENGDSGQPWNIQDEIVQKDYLELYAVWNALEFQLLFNANAGGATVENMPSAASLIMGALLPKPGTVPTREGTQFKHWSSSPQGDDMWDFENGTMPAGELTLYAIWKEDDFTITYDALGGTPATQAETLDFNAPIPGKVSQPTRKDFVFTGWYEDINATIPWSAGGAMPAKNFKVYAGWSHEYISVTFNGGNAGAQNVPEDFKALIGKNTSFAEYQPGAEKTPVLENHVFIGWLDDAGTVLQDNLIVPTHDLHLVAQWEKIIMQTPPENVVVYIGTKTKVEIESGFNYTFTYSDLLHRKHVLQATLQWNASVLQHGGVAKIDLVFSESGGKATVFENAFAVYVLKNAKINSQHSQTFRFGSDITTAGLEWNAVCNTERPDFENQKIIRAELPLSFHLNGTNTRAAGTYAPSFTAVYMNYFGDVSNLKHIVEAVVLPVDGGNPFDYWQVVASQMRNNRSAKQMFISKLNYTFGGDPILFAPDLYAKRILARPADYTLMTADALASVKETQNSQLQVDMGWLQWYFNTQDFSNGEEHYGVYPLDVTAETNQEWLKNFAADYNAMPLQFKMNKSWNGNPTMQVTVNAELANSARQGNTLYMFWYNADTQRLELIGDMSDNGNGDFSIRMKSVNQHYIILDELPLDENGNPNFVISDKTNPLSEELWQLIEELNEGNPNEITVVDPEIQEEKEEDIDMIDLLFPSRLCVIIIIILLIIIAILLFLYLRARKKIKDLLREESASELASRYVDGFEDDDVFASEDASDYVNEERGYLHGKNEPPHIGEDLNNR